MSSTTADAPAGATLTIDRVIPGGRGMGRCADGRPAFVEGAFVGDVVELREVKDKRSFVEVLSLHVIEPSSDRVKPACPHHDECGGCDWMSITPAAQLQGKESMLRQALLRTGRLDLEELGVPVTIHASAAPTRYRSRVRLQVKDGRVGFFSKGSHQLVEVDDCLVSTELLWDAVSRVRAVVHGAPKLFASVAHVEVRVFSQKKSRLTPESASVAFVWGPGGQPSPAAIDEMVKQMRPLEEQMTVRMGRTEVALQSYEPVRGVRALAPVGGFTQVNEAINQQLVARVLEVAATASAKNFLDLYCGSGNFSLPLLAQGLQGVGVEQSREAIAAARRGARELGLEAEFHAQASKAFVEVARRERRHFDMAVVDPPRAGAKDVVSALAKLKVPVLVMISCDPATLARDLRDLTEAGYRLRSVEGFDMFPQTHHLETLVVLDREESPRLSSPAP